MELTLMRKFSTFLVLVLAGNAWAQSPDKAPPVVVKRTAPQKANSTDATLQNKIDSDLKALKQDPLPSTTNTTQPTVPADQLPPTGYKSPTDLPLTPTAQA